VRGDKVRYPLAKFSSRVVAPLKGLEYRVAWQNMRAQLDERKIMNKALLFVTLLFTAFIFSCAKDSAYREALSNGEEVIIDATSLKPDIPQFFTYHSANKGISLFVIKIDGEIFSFLDACLSCSPRKGFSFNNGYFTCKVCGTKYSVAEVRHGIGGCYPIRVPGRLKDGKYYIDISALRQ
jgi:uncharacterized membrane protein